MLSGTFGKCTATIEVTKMDDKEIQQFINHFKGVLPDPDNYPKCFDYYYNVWKFYKGKL